MEKMFDWAEMVSEAQLLNNCCKSSFARIGINSRLILWTQDRKCSFCPTLKPLVRYPLSEGIEVGELVGRARGDLHRLRTESVSTCESAGLLRFQRWASVYLCPSRPLRLLSQTEEKGNICIRTALICSSKRERVFYSPPSPCLNHLKAFLHLQEHQRLYPPGSFSGRK